jgi:hypothetical protein
LEEAFAMKAITELKHGLSEGWKSLAEGWARYSRIPNAS